jgi:AcrR family transcriptional regulator
MALSQSEIISTAFQEWGKSNFTNTSLSSLSSSLGVTKAAMYRHFANKDELIEGMRRTVLEEFYRLADQFCDQGPYRTLQGLLDAYLSVFFLYYLKNRYHFQFFLQYVGKQEELLDSEFKHHSSRIKSNFLPVLTGKALAGKPAQKSEKDFQEAEVLFDYVRTSLIFWISLAIHCGSRITKEKTEELRTNLAGFILHGIRSEQQFEIVDWASFVSSCEVSETEMLPPDRIFAAIADSVAEHGLWQTTVEQIADTLGMRKSSLYFYFKNKKAMIAAMLRREQKQLRSIFKSKEKQYPTTEEKLGCYAVIVASYLLQKPSILITFNWLRIQGIEIEMKKPDLNKLEKDYAFLVGLLENVEKDLHGLRPFELVSLLNMSIFRQVMIDFRSGVPRNEIYNRIYVLLHCFYNGIERRT